MLTSVAALKQLLEIAAEVDTEDTLLSTILATNDALVKRYCQRTFEYSTFVEYHDGNGGRAVLVNEYPVSTVSSIYDDRDHAWPESTKITDSDILRFSADKLNAGVVEVDNTTLGRGQQNIKITYTGGYTAAQLAAEANDLVGAVEKMCQADYLENKTMQNSTGESEENPDSLRDQAYDILDRNYRRVNGF